MPGRMAEKLTFDAAFLVLVMVSAIILPDGLGAVRVKPARLPIPN